jgi:hypothetical protein
VELIVELGDLKTSRYLHEYVTCAQLQFSEMSSRTDQSVCSF